MDKKVNWRKSEVISYLELKIIEDRASDEEIQLYEDYKWFGELNKNYTYKSIIKEMNYEFGGE